LFLASLAVPDIATAQLAPEAVGVAAAQPINPPPTAADIAEAAAAVSTTAPTEADRALIDFDRRAQEIAFSSYITILSLIAGLGFLSFFTVILFLSKGGFTTETSRNFIVLVVVISAILLIVMGYTEQQVAPAFGLLGTILGYVFGRVQGEAERSAARASDPMANSATATEQSESKDGESNIR
jgi:hypothetical protein